MASGGRELAWIENLGDVGAKDTAFIDTSNLSVTEKVVLGATAPIWLPLGMCWMK